MEGDLQKFGNAFPLADFIHGVSEEIRKASEMPSKEKKDPILKLNSCELTLSITSTFDAEGGIKFWVVDLTAGASRENVQSVTIKLDPKGEVVQGIR
jgi:hypothetical protein